MGALEQQIAALAESRLIPVDPQPTWIESSGRWRWPLPDHARFPGCCTEVVSASREWWEYAPSEAKPHPMAEGVELRDGVWYWAVPEAPAPALSRAELDAVGSAALEAWFAAEDGPPKPLAAGRAAYAKLCELLPQTTRCTERDQAEADASCPGCGEPHEGGHRDSCACNCNLCSEPALSDETMARRLFEEWRYAAAPYWRELRLAEQEGWVRAAAKARELCARPVAVTERELAEVAAEAANLAPVRDYFPQIARAVAARLGYRLQEEGAGECSGDCGREVDEGGRQVHDADCPAAAPPPEPQQQAVWRAALDASEEFGRREFCRAEAAEAKVAELRGRLAAVIEAASTPGEGA